MSEELWVVKKLGQPKRCVFAEECECDEPEYHCFTRLDNHVKPCVGCNGDGSRTVTEDVFNVEMDLTVQRPIDGDPTKGFEYVTAFVPAPSTEDPT